MATPSSLMAEAHRSPRYLTTDELDLFSADDVFPCAVVNTSSAAWKSAHKLKLR